MVCENHLYNSSGTATKFAGTKFMVGNAPYFLRNNTALDYHNWQGAYAMLRISDPLNPKNLITFGAAADQTDIAHSVEEIFMRRAQRMHALRTKGSELEKEEQSELAGLEKLFRAA